MKRILILTACVVLCTALAANASVDDGVIRGTLVPLNSTQNEIDLTLLSTGWPVDGSGHPELVDALDVTCVTVDPGASFHLGGSSGNWQTHVMSNAIQDAPGASPASPAECYFNFDTKVDGLVNANLSGPTSTFSSDTVTSFTGSCLTSTLLSPTGNNFLGSLIVNNGMWVRLTGPSPLPTPPPWRSRPWCPTGHAGHVDRRRFDPDRPMLGPLATPLVLVRSASPRRNSLTEPRPLAGAFLCPGRKTLGILAGLGILKSSRR